MASQENKNGLAELRAVRSQCRSHFRSVAIFSIFVNILMLTGPLFMLQTYDRVLSSRSEETLVALLLLVTGLFLMMGLLEYARGRVLARAGARFQTLLDIRVFEAVMRRSVAPQERARPNTAARDLDAVRQLLAGPAPFALFDIPWTPIFLGAMGPLGRKHAASWADGWYPVDIAMGDVATTLAEFREEVREAGRDPGEVEFNIQIMDTANLDKLKTYRDLGVQRATIGVSVDLWDQPEAVMPMIDTYARVIPELAD